MKKLFIITLFLSVQSVWAIDDVTDELDAAWDKIKMTVSKGDFRSYKSVYHRDAILVNGITSKSYPIKDAFAGWKQGFEDTRSGKISAHLDVKFSQRLTDKTTAHETGIFHYYTIDKDGKQNDSYVHFESLWVAKNNKWFMMMEYQKSTTDKVEWDETGAHHRFNDAEKWAGIFEKPKRDDWQKPDELINSLGIVVDAVITDIGSATGYFPVRFARVATDGKVYGVDIEQTLVDYLNNRAKKENLSNLVSILGQPDDPKIPEKSDLIFICNTYHHIQDRGDYFENMKQYMQPDGRLVIVDFKKGDLPVGPPDGHKLPSGIVTGELEDAGYRQVSHVLELPYQYVLVFNLAN